MLPYTAAHKYISSYALASTRPPYIATPPMWVHQHAQCFFVCSDVDTTTAEARMKTDGACRVLYISETPLARTTANHGTGFTGQEVVDLRRNFSKL